MAIAPVPQMEDVGTTPPWLRNTASLSSIGPATGGGTAISDPYQGGRGQLAGLIAGPGGPVGPGSSIGSYMGDVGNTGNPVDMGSSMDSTQGGLGNMGSAPGMTGISNPGASTGAPVGPSSTNPGDLHQMLSSAYDAATGTGSSALQPADSTATSGLHPLMPKSSVAPIQSTPMAASVGTAPTPAATPATSAPATPAPAGSPQTDQATSPGSAPPAQASTATPSSIITGSQSPFKGGPNVTTAGVNYSGMPNVSQDFSGDAQRAADAAYKGATTYFDTDFGRQNSDLQNQLAAQGFAPGSEGYNRQMELAQRSQDTARTQAAEQAQQIGFQQSGDLMQRALAARQQAVGEQQNDADRAYSQSAGIAGLGLGARGQDLGLQSAQTSAGAAQASASAGLAAANYRADLESQLGLRQLGLSQDNQDWSHAMQMAQLGQGSVPGLNFGSAAPLDVSGAYGIASANNNANLNRGAANSNALYTLGGNLLGSYLRGP